MSYLLAFVLFANCSGGVSQSDYMVLEKVQYVNTFPQTFFLDNETELDLDIIGVQDFCIYDSLLILSTSDKEGLCSFVSLPDYKFLGKFLTQGHGPYELYQSLLVGSDVKFFREKENIFASIYNSQKGELYKMNVDESIKNNKIDIYMTNNSIPPFLFNFVVIDSVTFLCKEINGKETQQIRYMLVNGKEVIPPHLEKLNLAKIREVADFNILSTITKYDFDKKRIIEMPVGLNYINMYSIDGSFSKTICIGKQLDNIGEIQNIQPWWNRIYTFADLRLFPKFWGVVYVNEDYRTNEIKYQTNETLKTQFPNILLFDWNGKPLAELKLNNFITSFDIDLVNGYLYTQDLNTDLFCKYDIRDILHKIL